MAQAVVIAGEEKRLATITGALKRVGWETTGFLNPQEALQHLAKQEYQVVFCDTVLHGASAAGFFTWTRRHAPHVPFYLIGTLPEGGKLEPTAVLRYPPDEDELPHPSQTAKAPSTAPKRNQGGSKHNSFSGNTSIVSLWQLLETLSSSKRSAHVELVSPQGKVHLYLDEDRIMHAEATADGQTLSGFRALVHALTLENCPYTVLPPKQWQDSSIGMTASGALAQASLLANELRHYRHLLANLQRACPEVHDLAIGYVLGKIPHCHVGEPRFFMGASETYDVNRKRVGKLQELTLAVSDSFILVKRFGENGLLTLRAPVSSRDKLMRVVKEVLEGIETPIA